MATGFQQAVGSIIYAASWILLLRDKWKFFPLGRAMSVFVCAGLMVAFSVLSTDAAMHAIHVPTLVLLTAMMLLSSFLEKYSLYELLAVLFSGIKDGTPEGDTVRTSPLKFLIKLAIASAVGSALITNDAISVVLTPVIVNAVTRMKLPPAPFLVATATFSNIGSSLSPIGNPQNMIIALMSGLTFFQFLGAMTLAVLIGLLLNFAVIVIVYRKSLLSGISILDETSVQGAAPSSEAPANVDNKEALEWMQIIKTKSLSSQQVLQNMVHDSVEDEILRASSSFVRRRQGVPLDVVDVTSGSSGYTHPAVNLSSNSTGPSVSSSSSSSSITGNVFAATNEAISRHRSQHGPSLSMSDPVSASGVGLSFSSTDMGAKQEREPEQILSQTSRILRLTSRLSYAAPVDHTTEVASTLVPMDMPSGLRKKLNLALLALSPVALLFADQWIGLAWTAAFIVGMLFLVDPFSPQQQLALVDGALLFFFSGLFVTVEGFNSTGIPASIWSRISGAVNVDTLSGVMVFTAIVLIASNVVSNVPLTLLLAPFISELSNPGVAWLLLAWVSTMGGNLTLLGSVANLIVAERSKDTYPLTFIEYLKVGAPSTVLICIVCTPIVWVCSKSIMS